MRAAHRTEAPHKRGTSWPCDRRPANQLFGFVVPPSSFPVRVHAESCEHRVATGRTAISLDLCKLCAADRDRENVKSPQLTNRGVRTSRVTPQIAAVNAFICGVAILVIRRADDI